ncbi:hypothetical protein SL053_001043 [Flavobacterium psychrophilum]|uniref:hypothetical protein n=1 Tax=Flavobacterium psychrophilum TaxID=96345 RepID=UPI0029D8372E|nr:hypothetical protein [Flavobacterium psychrophilum]ELY2017155.1 hypothetical protein [Flavobacterium psychrophilum]
MRHYPKVVIQKIKHKKVLLPLNFTVFRYTFLSENKNKSKDITSSLLGCVFLELYKYFYDCNTTNMCFFYKSTKDFKDIKK